MTLAQAVILGLVQGFAEFLPISSSAHLALAPFFLNFPDPGLAFDVALHAGTGQPLWRANLGSGMSNGPISYMLDGAQYVVVGAGDTLFGFAMHGK